MMKRKWIAAATLLVVTLSLTGQSVAQDTYWFYLADKADNGYLLTEPVEFLTERSVARRAWQSLPVDETDLPVTDRYIDSLVSLGLEIRHISRWLNGVLVTSTDSALIDTIANLSFIDTIPWEPDPGKLFFPGPPSGSRFEPPLSPAPAFSYGHAAGQNFQIDLDYLHEKGYTGAGVHIAVMDAGFSKLPELRVFEPAVTGERIVAERNFVDSRYDVYGYHTHGTHVSSIIVADWPDSLVGAAPGASLLLGLTENVMSETRIEEFAWIEAAEWADSLGADIINTSLGYTTFDNPLTNYTYSDMDGRTAMISIANGMTAGKGMVSVTSAGNSGNDEWFYIGAPGDATDILSVGAVDASGVIASFSSRGPTYDRRIKPEVSAMGVGTALQTNTGEIRQGNGTSYASPLIAGGAALLWQAYPDLSARELMQWIIEAGDRAGNPDVNYGYGIPSFKAAFHAITSAHTAAPGDRAFSIYPNPFRDVLYIRTGGPEGRCSITIYDLQGRPLHAGEIMVPGPAVVPAHLVPGIYFIEIRTPDHIYQKTVIKQ